MYAPVPAQHQLENWLRAASSTNTFFAVDADARRTLLVTSKVERRWVTKSAGTVTHSCLPCSGSAPLHVASCIGPESNVSAFKVFVFELEAIISMQGRGGNPRALAQPL